MLSLLNVAAQVTLLKQDPDWRLSAVRMSMWRDRETAMVKTKQLRPEAIRVGRPAYLGLKACRLAGLLPGLH